MRKPRKNDTPVEKVAILRRHLIDHVPSRTSATSISSPPPCSTSGRSRSWRTARPPSSGRARARWTPPVHHRRPARQAQRKDEVVSELMEEHIKLKKSLGSSERSLGSPRHPGRVRSKVDVAL